MNANGAVGASRMLGWFLRWCALAAIMAAFSVGLRAQTAYTVTRFDDANAGTLETGGGFGPGNSGDLRYGLFQAMAAGGANTITFACGAPPCTITLSAPLPPIFTRVNIAGFSLTIDGGTEGNVVLDGNSAGGQYNRVFFVDNVAVTLRNLVIQNAAVVGGAGGSGVGGGGGGAGFGACLFVNQSTAAVIVQNTTFSDCAATGGQGGSYAAVGGTGGGGGLAYPGGSSGTGLDAFASGGGGGGVSGAGQNGLDEGLGAAGGSGGGGGATGGRRGQLGGSAYAGNGSGNLNEDYISDGGNGGYGYNYNYSGYGGFGGGGGGTSRGLAGPGGFGGGGGGGGRSLGYAGAGGFGGFGGGNGAGVPFSYLPVPAPVGGVAGGAAAPGGYSGSGGAAAGPAIFVVSGSVTLYNTIGTGTFTATPGAAGGADGAPGTANSAPVFNYAGTVNGSTTVGPILNAFTLLEPVGQTSAAQTATLTFPAAVDAATPFSINVLTQGAPNLDFKFLSGGTCVSGTAYAAKATCTVEYTFTPPYPGIREGAITLTDGSGDLLASTFIDGTGVGPQIAFNPAPVATLGGTFYTPTAVAVDASGDVFATNYGNIPVAEIVAVNGSIPSNPVIRALGGGFAAPWAVAVDGAGDVFVGDLGYLQTGAVYEILAVNGSIPPSNPTILTLGGGVSLPGPTGLAVDGNGNVFVSGGSVVREIPAAGGYTTVNTLAGGFSQIIGLAVDGSGNVFVADAGTSTVKEILAAGGYTTVNTLAANYNQVYGLAVDAAGDLYLADPGNGAVEELPAASGYTTIQVLYNFGDNLPLGVGVDGAGDVFVSPQGTGPEGQTPIFEIQRSQPPSLSFAGTTTGLTSTDSPQTVAVENVGNQPLTAVSPGLAIGSSSFTQGGLESDCTSSFSLAPGAGCNLDISFIPQTAGPISSAVTLTDNALNAAAAMQSVPLSGTGLGQTPGVAVTSPTINYATPSTSLSALISFSGTTGPTGAVTFTVDGGSPVAAMCTGTVSPLSCTAPFATATLNVGAHIINVSIAATPGFAANSGMGTLTVNPIAPSINFTVTGQTYGVAPFRLAATSNSTGAITYSLLSGHASLVNSTLTITGAGMVTVQASQVAFGNYTAGVQMATFTVAQATPVITWPAPAPIVTGTPLSAAQLDATASFNGAALGGTFAYQPALNAVLGSGAQTLSASFTPADTTDFTSASAKVSITVNPATVSVSIPSTTETYQTWTNFVIGPIYTGSRVPTGTVTLYDNGAALTTLTLGGDGKAYYTAGPFNVGANVITATYSGNAYFPAGASGPATITVLPAPVNFQASCWGGTVWTVAYQCTISVSASTTIQPGGNITYSLDGAAPAAVALVSGAAAFTVPTLPAAGSHKLVLNYAAQGNFAAGATITESFTTAQGATALQISPSNYSPAAGSTITLSGTANTPSSGIPPGSVTVYDNGNTIGTANIGNAGAISFPVASISKGTHSYHFTYAGSTNYSAATSASASVTAH